MAKCSAHRSRDRAPCRAYAIRGGKVCTAHGGRIPQVKKAAKERLAQAEWARKYGGGPAARNVEPSQAVLEQLAWSSTHVAWYREKLQTEGAQWADRYDRERSALTGLARTAHLMGIEERQVALAEAMGAQLMLLIARVSQDPEIPVSARPILRRVFARELRAIDGGSGA